MAETAPIRVFIAHETADASAARELGEQLDALGFDLIQDERASRPPVKTKSAAEASHSSKSPTSSTEAEKSGEEAKEKPPAPATEGAAPSVEKVAEEAAKKTTDAKTPSETAPKEKGPTTGAPTAESPAGGGGDAPATTAPKPSSTKAASPQAPAAPSPEDIDRLAEMMGRADAVVAIVGAARGGDASMRWRLDLARRLQRPIFRVRALKPEVGHAAPNVDDFGVVDLDGAASDDDMAERLSGAIKATARWLQNRDRISKLARRWADEGRKDRQLLTGRALQTAEAWRSTPSGAAPQPYALHHEYIDASRCAAHLRQNYRLAGTSLLTAGALLLAGFALLDRSETRRSVSFVETQLFAARAELAAKDDELKATSAALSAAEVGRDDAELKRAVAEARRAALEARERRALVDARVNEDKKVAAAARKQAPAIEQSAAYRDMAFSSAKAMIFEVAEPLLAPTPGVSKASQGALRQAERILAQLMEKEPDNHELRTAKAALHGRAGAVLERDGWLDAADAEYLKGIELLEILVAEKPRNAALLGQLEDMLTRAGALRMRRGDAEGAIELIDVSLEMARRLYEARPESLDAQHRLATVLTASGSAHLDLGHRAEARARLKEAAAFGRKALAAAPADTSLKRNLALALERSGDLRLAEGDRSAALAAYGESLGIRRAIAEPLGPDAAEARKALAKALVKQHDATYGPRSEAAMREAAAIAFDLEALGLLGPEDAEWVAEMRRRLGEL